MGYQQKFLHSQPKVLISGELPPELELCSPGGGRRSRGREGGAEGGVEGGREERGEEELGWIPLPFLHSIAAPLHYIKLQLCRTQLFA